MLRLLRVFVSIIFKLLFVSALDVFLVGMSCVAQTPHSPVCVLYNFRDVVMTSSGHLVHAAIGIVMCIIMISISFLVSLADSEQNVLSHELLATMDAAVKMRSYAGALTLTLCANFLIRYMKLLSVIQFTVFFALLLDKIYSVPFYWDFANYMFSAIGAHPCRRSAVRWPAPTGTRSPSLMARPFRGTHRLFPLPGGLLAWAAVLLVAKMYGGGELPTTYYPPPHNFSPFAPAPAPQPGLPQHYYDYSRLLTNVRQPCSCSSQACLALGLSVLTPPIPLHRSASMRAQERFLSACL